MWIPIRSFLPPSCQILCDSFFTALASEEQFCYFSGLLSDTCFIHSCSSDVFMEGGAQGFWFHPLNRFKIQGLLSFLIYVCHKLKYASLLRTSAYFLTLLFCQFQNYPVNFLTHLSFLQLMFINYFYSRQYVRYHDFKISFNKLRACIDCKRSSITMHLMEFSIACHLLWKLLHEIKQSLNLLIIIPF